MDTRSILITCSIITTVLSFPTWLPLGSKYLDREVIMCGIDLNAIANNLCMDKFPNFTITDEFHPDKSLLLESMCCAQICTASDIFTNYCLGQRTESSTVTILKVTTEIDIYPRPIDYWYGSFILG